MNKYIKLKDGYDPLEIKYILSLLDDILLDVREGAESCEVLAIWDLITQLKCGLNVKEIYTND